MSLNPADRDLSDADLITLFSTPPTIPERSRPALLFDEGVDQRSIPLIQQRIGLFVTSVQQEGLAEEPSDVRILAAARSQGWTLVAEDRVFYRVIPARLSQLGLRHAGIVVVKKYTPPQRLSLFFEMAVKRCETKDLNVFTDTVWRVR